MVRSAVQSLSNNKGHETYGISSARIRNSMDSLFLLLSRVIGAMISGECHVDITPIIEDMKVRIYAIIDNFYAASWQLLFNIQCLSVYGCQCMES